MFTREIYMQRKLSRLMGMDSVSDEIVLQVKDELKKYNAPASIKNIRLALRKLGLVCYYDLAPSISKKLLEKIEQINLEKLTECSVCYEESTTMMKLKCNHMFCIVCIEKINDHGLIKCPLCRGKQNVFTNINYKDKKIIIDEFIKNQDQYVINKNMIPFDIIIRDIAAKKGIRLD
jgi:hypothetical protein